MQTAMPTPTKSGHAAVNGVNYYYAVYGKGEPLLAASRRPRPDRDVRSQPDQARAEPAGDRRRSAGPRPHRARRSRDQPGRHGRRHGRRAEEARLRQGRRARLFDGRRRRVPARRPASGNGAPRWCWSSGAFAQDGFYPEMLPQQAAVGAAMAEQMKDTPMYKSYVAVAPHPEEFPKLLDQMGALHAQAVRLVGGRQEADHAGDARLRRQRHVSGPSTS